MRILTRRFGIARPVLKERVVVPRGALDPCAGVVCPPSQSCDARGACVTTQGPCVGVVCSPGFVCDSTGACVPMPGWAPAGATQSPFISPAQAADDASARAEAAAQQRANDANVAAANAARQAAAQSAGGGGAALVSDPTADSGAPVAHSQDDVAAVQPPPANPLGMLALLFIAGKALAFF